MKNAIPFFIMKKLKDVLRNENVVSRDHNNTVREPGSLVISSWTTLLGDAGTFLLTNIGNPFSQKHIAVSSCTLVTVFLSTSFALSNPLTRIRANLVVSTFQLEAVSRRVGTGSFTARYIFI